MNRYRASVEVSRRVEVEFELDERGSPANEARRLALEVVRAGEASADDYSYSTSFYRVIPEVDAP